MFFLIFTYPESFPPNMKCLKTKKPKLYQVFLVILLKCLRNLWFSRCCFVLGQNNMVKPVVFQVFLDFHPSRILPAKYEVPENCKTKALPGFSCYFGKMRTKPVVFHVFLCFGNKKPGKTRGFPCFS